MQILKSPKKSSFHKYYENNRQFINEIKGMNHDQVALIKYISSLLSVKEFRKKYGYAYETLNNLIIKFFNLNTKCFISNEAYSEIDRKKIFRSEELICRKEINKRGCEIDYAYLIPIKNISNELFARNLPLMQIKNILINSTTKIIVHKNEKKLIKNISAYEKSIFNSNFKINNNTIEKLFGIGIYKSKLTLIN
tara:strand:+ start:3747 stop:4328 length:582 start_codon:yes stop_codon:yes gene_type:complete